MRLRRFPWSTQVLALACGAVFGGCGGPSTVAPAPEPTPPARPDSEPAHVELELGEGVTVMHPTCAPDMEERCNAVDDDCDGQLDEGCGIGAGALRVAVHWNTDADLELAIEGPEGVQVEQRGSGCDAEPRRREHATVERLEPGAYAVALRYADECGEDTGPTTATLSIATHGRVAGVLNRTLAPGERAVLSRLSLSSAQP